MTDENGRLLLDDESAGRPEADSTVDSAEARKLTAEELKNLTVKLDDGTEVSGKEFYEARRRQPDVAKILDSERAKLKEQIEAEVRQKVTEEVRGANKVDATDLANALNEVLGKGKKVDPFTDRESAIAYVTGKLANDADGAIADLVGQLMDDRGRLDATVKSLKADFDAKLDAIKKASEVEKANADMRREIEAVQAKWPDYDPKGGDEFSALVNRLVADDKPSAILGDKAGIDLKMTEIAAKVETYLDRRAEERVASRRKAEEARVKTAAIDGAPGGGYVPSDEIQAELKAAGNDIDKINAVMQKVARGHR